MLDSGASSYFIDKDLVKYYNQPTIDQKYPEVVEVIEDRPLALGDVTHEIEPLNIILELHQSTVVFNMINSPSKRDQNTQTPCNESLSH